jgi:hypothetical protein
MEQQTAVLTGDALQLHLEELRVAWRKFRIEYPREFSRFLQSEAALSNPGYANESDDRDLPQSAIPPAAP